METSIKAYMSNDSVKKKFTELLGKKAQGFITSVLQICASNDLLSKADPASVYNAAAMAATLDLPLNNNFGFAYIIPYNLRQQDGSYKVVAQFQIGYKGIIQLAQRSGQYKTISAAPIYDGQLISQNPLTGFEFDFTAKKSDVIIGFAGFFQLINGFEKTLFMTIEEMKAHGMKYSKTFSKSSSLWNTDFVTMGSKTVIKLLLSKFGILSIEMQQGLSIDQALIHDDKGEEFTYIDNEEVQIDKEAERVRLMIEDCNTHEELDTLQEQNPDFPVDLFEQRKEALSERK